MCSLPSARAHALGQGALRVEFEFQLARQVLAHELGVLADVGGQHLADLAGVEQLAQPEAVDAAVVRGNGDVLHAAVDQSVDQKLRNAAKAETARRDEHPVEQKAVEGLLRRAVDLLHLNASPVLV